MSRSIEWYEGRFAEDAATIATLHELRGRMSDVGLIAKLRRLNAALLELLVGRRASGGWWAKLPYSPVGYPGGTRATDGHVYHFETREAAVAAVRVAAGIGDEKEVL